MPAARHPARPTGVTAFRVTTAHPIGVADLARVGDIRRLVWQDEGHLEDQTFPYGLWIDAWDRTAPHWLVEGHGGLVGSARLVIAPTLAALPGGEAWAQVLRPAAGPYAYLSRLVVRRDARLHGLATLLNRRRVAAARTAGVRTILAHATPANARLLAALGFGVVVTPPHRDPDRPGLISTALALPL